MIYSEQIRLPLTEKMYKDLNKYENKVQFIRDAINEKLDRSEIENKTLNSYEQFMQKIIEANPSNISGSLSDLQITGNLLYEEMRKQNEALKIILRRVTIVNGVSCQVLTKLTNIDDVKDKVKEANEIAAKEIDNINL